MRSPLTIATLLAFSLGGCVVYDNNCDDSFPLGHDASDETPAPEYWLTPDQAERGETFIASLESDMAVDFEAVVDIEFMGDVAICTSQARDFELLLTLTVGPDAELGEVDAVIEMEDGTHTFVAGLLTVTPDGEGGSADDGSSDDGSSGDGSSDDSSDDGGSPDEGEDGEDGEDSTGDSEDDGFGGC